MVRPIETLPIKAELPKGSISERLSALQEELKKNPKNPEVRSEIASLRRELNRAKQFTDITKEDSKKIVSGRGFDSLNANELLKIDRSEGIRGLFLSKTFLYKQTQGENGLVYEESTDGNNLKEGDTLLVDFGKNESANRRIGLGHMLPVSIEYVKVNGKIGVRSIVNNRVGYYDESSSKGYIPVFTGDIVTIPTKSEIATFDEKIKNSGLSKNTNQKATDEANDAYIERLENTSLDAVEINTSARESYNFWISKGLSHAQASGLVANEFVESSFNPRAKGDSGNALGIFQWHAPRRENIKSATGIDIGTASHEEQLKAAYWEMTNGEYGSIFNQLKDTKTASEAAHLFATEYERCASEHVAKRLTAAESYAVLLDSTNRSASLGDHVVRRGPASSVGTDNCGAGVRELLKSYGIHGLPETGANGENWNEILDARGDQFYKVKISHPREAYPGAILVYENGVGGSEKNQQFGHVEIKGSDGRYYSYYASPNAAGSAKTKEKDPTEYKKLTGFIGYAYYPRAPKTTT